MNDKTKEGYKRYDLSVLFMMSAVTLFAEFELEYNAVWQMSNKEK